MASKKGIDAVIVAGMLAGDSRTHIAVAAGVSERTLRRRLQDPEIISAIAEGRAQQHGRLLGQWFELADLSMDELRSALASDKPSMRLQAARLVFMQSNSIKQAADDARLVALEIAQAQTRARLEDLA